MLREVPVEADLRGTPKAKREELARTYIDQVGLTGFEKHYPHQLSGGMQQRTGLARALAMQPRMLLMDEPFDSLDAQMRTLLQDSLLRVCESNKTTVLFVTHSVEEAVYQSDRISIFSARPGRQMAEVLVDLPKPRYDYDARSDPRFTETRKQVTQLLAEKTDYYGRRDAVPAD